MEMRRPGSPMHFPPICLAAARQWSMHACKGQAGQEDSACLHEKPMMSTEHGTAEVLNCP
jgi:hypothetical protein